MIWPSKPRLVFSFSRKHQSWRLFGTNYNNEQINKGIYCAKKLLIQAQKR